MIRISIREALRTDAKPYLWLLERDGLEMGLGRAGSYSRHAHRYYVDFIYSPWGLELHRTSCHAVLARPGTPFGPLQCGDFFFVKFLLSGSPYSIPDKVDVPECDHFDVSFASLLRLSVPFELDGRYYDAAARDLLELRIEAHRESLIMESSRGWRLEVTR